MALTVSISMASRINKNIRAYIPRWSSIFLLAFFIIGLQLNGAYMPLSPRGFFCTDQSIRYPFKPDTVNMKWLMLIALIIPSCTISWCDRKLIKPLFNDLCRHRQSNTTGRRPDGTSQRNRKLTPVGDVHADDINQMNGNNYRYQPVQLTETTASTSINDSNEISSGSTSRDSLTEHSDERIIANSRGPGVISSIRLSSDYQSELRIFFLGFVYTIFLTGLSKVAGGRLRPHFYTRCQPDIDCDDAKNHNVYHIDYNCTAQLKPFELSYIQTSWPSGHASIMWFSMLYMSLYIYEVSQLLHNRIKLLGSLTMPTVQIILLCLAGYIGMTRISDYHHHPLDVLGGSLIGVLVAIMVTQFVDRTTRLLANNVSITL